MCNPKTPPNIMPCCAGNPVCVLCRFRELGCSSSAVRIQVPAEAGGESTTSTSYNITLLPSPDKTLAQSFPKPKVLKKAGPR